MTEKALETQEGGDHYKDMTIQPAVFCEVNGLSLLEGNIIKRICRWKTKGDPLGDLNKIKHEVDLLLEIHDVEAQVEKAKAAEQVHTPAGRENVELPPLETSDEPD